MKKVTQSLGEFLTSIKVGFFLSVRQIRGASIWTNVLVICVMTLTFLNLVVVSGILVGLIEGAVDAVKEHYLGDVIVSNLKNREYIDKSQNIINLSRSLPDVKAVTARYVESGFIESETSYKKVRKPNELDERVPASFAGINPVDENMVTNIKELIVEGEFLNEDDYDKVVVGALLLKKYLDFESDAFPVLDEVEIGSKIRVTVNGNTRDVFVKGIIRSKVDEVDRRVFFVDSQLRNLINRYDYNVDEIILKLKPKTNPITIKDSLIGAGVGNYAKVQTQEEAEPKFIKDMKKTFNILGNVISSIGLVVAAITIFIVVFVNAITRRKYIGILKGVGIDPKAIETAYIFQAISYAIVGTIAGCIIVFLVLKPYFDANPINFPFSDGILVATFEGTAFRIMVLMIATLISGYIPARLITKENTLDAILNR